MTGAKFGSIESPISINEDDSFFARVHLPLDGERTGIVTGSSRFLEVPRKLCRGFQRA